MMPWLRCVEVFGFYLGCIVIARVGSVLVFACFHTLACLLARCSSSYAISGCLRRFVMFTSC